MKSCLKLCNEGKVSILTWNVDRSDDFHGLNDFDLLDDRHVLHNLDDPRVFLVGDWNLFQAEAEAESERLSERLSEQLREQLREPLLLLEELCIGTAADDGNDND